MKKDKKSSKKAPVPDIGTLSNFTLHWQLTNIGGSAGPNEPVFAEAGLPVSQHEGQSDDMAKGQHNQPLYLQVIQQMTVRTGKSVSWPSDSVEIVAEGEIPSE